MGLVYEPGTLDFVRSLPPAPKKRLRAALDILSQDPRDQRLDLRALTRPDGKAPVCRAKVGDYRIAFVIDRRTTRVVRIFHRRDGYGWLERLA